MVELSVTVILQLHSVLTMIHLIGRQRETWPWWGLLGCVPHEEQQWNGQHFGKRWQWKWRRKFQPVPGAFFVGPYFVCRWGPLPASVHGLGGVSDWKWNGQHAQQQQFQFSSDPLTELPVSCSQPELPVPTTLTPTLLFIFITFFLLFAITHWFGGCSATGPCRRQRLSPWWVHLPGPLCSDPNMWICEADRETNSRDSSFVQVCVSAQNPNIWRKVQQTLQSCQVERDKLFLDMRIVGPTIY